MASRLGIVRPVCTRFPDSIGTWEETNLPLSCVLTPLQPQPKSNGKPKPLASIPKCLNCGAPHPTPMSHYSSYGYILCYLCGKTCSSSFDDQVSRRLDEGMSQRIYGDQIRSRNNGDVLEYSLPIKMNDNNIPMYEMNAMNYPPLWWIVVEGSTSRSYWNSVSIALGTVIAELPPYVHIGLAVASEKTLSIWNVHSPVPYVKNYHSTQRPELIFADVRTYQSHLQTALRAMADSMIATNGYLPLIKTVGVLLDQLHRDGRIVSSSLSSGKRPYAGGRILMILNGPPQEFKPTDKTKRAHEKFGHGGRGGACFEPGFRFAFSSSSKIQTEMATDLRDDDPEMGISCTKQPPSTDNTTATNDFTPTYLRKLHPHLEKKLSERLEELGNHCAEAAVGVDVLVVTQQPLPMIGLPFLKELCEKTGAPGPILFDLFTKDIVNILKKEIQSRIPRFFGGLLKIRLSPGFEVDMSPIETNKRHNANYMLAPSHIKKGLMGPGTSTKQESLWQVGVCDPMQTMMLDLQVTNKIQRFAFMEGLGEIALKSCMQICFAYTTIVKDAKSNEFKTVHRLRICTLRMPIADRPESLYSAIDLEALSIVLMHKLLISTFTEGLSATRLIGNEWLKCVMVCVYHSAQMEEKRLQNLLENGVRENSDKDDSQAIFHASSRLLNRKDGQLTQDDVVLGEGHEILRNIPLIVWCILQCDAFRLSSQQCDVSLDARCATLAQITSMNPSTFSKCIIPHIELWQSGNSAKGPITRDIGLSLEKISLHLAEQQKIDPNLVLFINAPYGIIVCDSRHLYIARNIDESNSNNGVEIGDSLQLAIQNAVESYRTPPPILYALDLSPTTIPWNDFLIEDSLNQASQNFEGWKKEIAVVISKDLDLEDS